MHGQNTYTADCICYTLPMQQPAQLFFCTACCRLTEAQARLLDSIMLHILCHFAAGTPNRLHLICAIANVHTGSEWRPVNFESPVFAPHLQFAFSTLETVQHLSHKCTCRHPCRTQATPTPSLYNLRSSTVAPACNQQNWPRLCETHGLCCCRTWT